MVKKLIILSVASTLVLALGSVWADTHYVDPAGSNTPPYTSWATAAHVIQDAINAASGGDLVDIAAGTYNAFLVNGFTTLTIQATSGATVSGTVYVTINIGGTDYYSLAGVRSSTGVTIKGLTIDASSISTSLNHFWAVLLYSSSGTIESNTIQNIGTTGLQSRGAVRIQDCSSATIKDNTISDFDKAGIVIRKTDTIDIQRNEISTSYHGTAPNGIDEGGDFAYHGTTGTIKDNTIYGCSYSSFTGNYETSYSGAGLLIIDASDNFTVEGNEIYNCDVGMDVESSVFSANLNLIHNNLYGCVLWTDDPVFHSNNINDNSTYGMYLTTGGSFSVRVNAENNWWGDVDGPEDSADDTGETTEVPSCTNTPANEKNTSASDGSLGNKVGDTSTKVIDYCPWLDVLIPVELTSFTASAANGMVTIIWSTASETENLGFHVYRSMTENGAFTQLNKKMIPGGGSSNEAHTYSYTDYDVEAGKTYYYKLADIDFNGNITFHGPIWVTVDNMPQKYTLAQNYPNPFNSETAFNFTLKQKQKVSLTISNLQGQVVRTLINEEKNAGYHSVLWKGTNDKGLTIASGVYIYTLTVNGFKASKRLTFLK